MIQAETISISGVCGFQAVPRPKPAERHSKFQDTIFRSVAYGGSVPGKPSKAEKIVLWLARACHNAH